MTPRIRVVVASATVVAVLAVGIVVPQTVVVRAESDSMRPTVDVGDIVVAERYHGADIERGAVVVFDDPGEWSEKVARLTGREAVAPTFVKRVIGLAGERIACCDDEGWITVDGVPLSEPYRAEPGALASVLAFEVTVPADAIFVLGDERETSIDSRYLGAVPVSTVVATMRFVVPAP